MLSRISSLFTRLHVWGVATAFAIVHCSDLKSLKIKIKMIGKQVQVVDVNGANIVYYQDNLKSVLTKCGSHPIAVVAVAGMFRKGKSFLLNMFLRFLHRETNNSDQLTRHVTGECAVSLLVCIA